MMGRVRTETRYTPAICQQLEIEAKKKKPELFIVEASKEPLNIVFIGHVDAGKSTLSGRILIQCHEVDE
jgi:peptide chain release factor subunit 3